MKLAPPVSDEQLSDLGVEAVGLLVAGQYETLAATFGYAIAYDRDPASAIEADLRLRLTETGAAKLVPPAPQSAKSVVHFQKNDTGLHSAVELEAQTDSGAKVLVSLVVTGQGDERHLTLEDVHVVA